MAYPFSFFFEWVNRSDWSYFGRIASDWSASALITFTLTGIETFDLHPFIAAQRCAR
jgi:hypothetical protein